MEPSSEQLAQQLVDLLDVEEIDLDLYRGARQPGGIGRIFGGQVIAQGLQAAQHTVEGKAAHSLHAYFMRPGNEDYPVIYRAVRDFEGRSFATRRVIAMQRGKPILNMACSFHAPEEGLSHQGIAMPDVPPPEALRSEREVRQDGIEEIAENARAFALRPRPIELRPVNPRSMVAPQPTEPRQAVWFRIAAPIVDDPVLHRAVLAYASDMNLMGTGMLPHGIGWMNPRFQGASLDHALWFHEPFRADDWLLYAMDSPWSGHARDFNRGSIFSRDGRLVASVAQEGLIRMREAR